MAVSLGWDQKVHAVCCVMAPRSSYMALMFIAASVFLYL